MMRLGQELPPAPAQIVFQVGFKVAHGQALVAKAFQKEHLSGKRAGRNDKPTKWRRIDLRVHENRNIYVCSWFRLA